MEESRVDPPNVSLVLAPGHIYDDRICAINDVLALFTLIMRPNMLDHLIGSTLHDSIISCQKVY